MKTVLTVTGVIAVMVLLILAVSIVFSVPVYFLWNWLMPTIFGLKEITLFQSWGLIVLCGFLFKGSSATTSKKD